MSGSGRGVAIAVVATTLLWMVAAIGAAVLLFGARDPAPPPVAVGGPAFVVPQVAPGPFPPSGVPGGPVPPMPLPAVPPVPLAGAELSRTRVEPVQGHLDELLRAEVQASEVAGRRVVAYFTSATCQPCRAAERTLAAADVRARLGQLQLVEVDVESFARADLRRAGMTMLDREIEAIPLFCVLRSSQPPVCIDGGAWGEDTDSNIRSVLVPFLVSPPSGISPHEPDRITPI